MRRLAREPPGPLDGHELAPRRAAAACRLSRVFSSCRSSPPLPAALACSGRRRPGSHPAKPSALAPLTPRCSCTRSVFVRRDASGRAWPPSSPSSPPMRCPGSGLQRFRLLLVSKPLRSAVTIARGYGVSASGWRWRSCLHRRGIPAGWLSAETRPSLPVQRHPRGSNRVGEVGRVDEEFSGSAGQRTCGVRSGHP